MAAIVPSGANIGNSKKDDRKEKTHFLFLGGQSLPFIKIPATTTATKVAANDTIMINPITFSFISRRYCQFVCTLENAGHHRKAASGKIE